MSASKIRAAALSWFRRDDYARALAVMSNPEALPATFDNWERRAKDQESRLKAQGLMVLRAIIDPDEFPIWCRARGLDVNAEARRRFAAEFAMRQVGDTH